MRTDFFEKLHEYLGDVDVTHDDCIDIENKIRKEFGCGVIYINTSCKKKRNRELMDEYLDSDKSSQTIDQLCHKYGIGRNRFWQIKKEYLT